MNERELLEACAKATEKGIYVGMCGDNYQLPEGWNPLDDDGDCARMEAQMRIDIEWNKTNIAIWKNGETYLCEELYADHPSPQAARRWASCRAVAEREKL